MARKKTNYNIKIDSSGKEGAVIYVRVSSQSQVKTGSGLESQEKLCREWAEFNNIQVVDVFSDGGVSGKYSSREALDQMITYLGEKNTQFTTVQYVIVDDIDRISRDVAGWLDIKLKIMSKGANIHSLKQQMAENPEGVLQQNLIMSFKQYERETNARRVSERMRARLLDGYRPWYQPPGYISQAGSRGGKILVKSEDAHIIKDGLELYARGEIVGRTSLQKYFIDRGVKSKKGNKVNLTWIQRLLEEQRLWLYSGYIIYPDRGIVEPVQGKHEPLIDRNTMEKILTKESPKQYYEKSSATDIGKKLPLRGLLYDVETKQVFSGGPSQGKKKLYYYYSCRIKIAGKTKTINLNHTDLHQEFNIYLDQFGIDDSVLDLFDAIMQDVWNNRQGLQTQINQDKLKRIKEIKKEIEKLMDRISKTSNEGMVDMYETKIISAQEEIKEINMQLSSTSEQQLISIDSLISNTKEILRKPSNIWQSGDVALQKMLISILFGGKIFYNKKTGFQTPEVPLIYHVLSGLKTQNNHVVEMMGVEPMSK